jgi:AcrR family transcriptional regulator
MDTKERIILAGEELFSQRGYDATSVSLICERAGVSKGAFFHYFSTKEEFFLEILDRWLSDLSQKIESYFKDQDKVINGLLRTTIIFEYIFKESKEKFYLFLEFLRKGISDERILKKLGDYFKRYKEYFSLLIERGKREGSFKDIDSEVLSSLIISYSIGIILQQIFDKDSDWGRISREGVNLIISSIKKEESKL